MMTPQKKIIPPGPFGVSDGEQFPIQLWRREGRCQVLSSCCLSGAHLLLALRLKPDPAAFGGWGCHQLTDGVKDDFSNLRHVELPFGHHAKAFQGCPPVRGGALGR